MIWLGDRGNSALKRGCLLVPLGEALKRPAATKNLLNRLYTPLECVLNALFVAADDFDHWLGAGLRAPKPGKLKLPEIWRN